MKPLFIASKTCPDKPPFYAKDWECNHEGRSHEVPHEYGEGCQEHSCKPAKKEK
jgi:hypothetical protein